MQEVEDFFKTFKRSPLTYKISWIPRQKISIICSAKSYIIRSRSPLSLYIVHDCTYNSLYSILGTLCCAQSTAGSVFNGSGEMRLKAFVFSGETTVLVACRFTTSDRVKKEVLEKITNVRLCGEKVLEGRVHATRALAKIPLKKKERVLPHKPGPRSYLANFTLP